MTAPRGHAVGPNLWAKWCPECGQDFVKGRSSKYCEPCRKKLKAWRKKTRREIRRAKLGLFPFQRTLRLRLDRRKPTKRTAKRYREHICLDCEEKFIGGARALRCIPCNDAHRRVKERADRKQRQARRGNGRAAGRTARRTAEGATASQATAKNCDSSDVPRGTIGNEPGTGRRGAPEVLALAEDSEGSSAREQGGAPGSPDEAGWTRA